MSAARTAAAASIDGNGQLPSNESPDEDDEMMMMIVGGQLSIVSSLAAADASSLGL